MPLAKFDRVRARALPAPPVRGGGFGGGQRGPLRLGQQGCVPGKNQYRDLPGAEGAFQLGGGSSESGRKFVAAAEGALEREERVVAERLPSRALGQRPCKSPYPQEDPEGHEPVQRLLGHALLLNGGKDQRGVEQNGQKTRQQPAELAEADRSPQDREQIKVAKRRSRALGGPAHRHCDHGEAPDTPQEIAGLPSSSHGSPDCQHPVRREKRQRGHRRGKKAPAPPDERAAGEPQE
mgnify:CR=1 FL=1